MIAETIAVENAKANKIFLADKRFHDWYRFILSFPPHLVRTYIDRFNLNSNDVLLDPFCGTGTTLIEAKLKNITSIGIEANPIVHFASTVKLNWDSDPEELFQISNKIRKHALDVLNKQGLSDQPSENNNAVNLLTLDANQERLLLKDSISPLPLHKILLLSEIIERYRTSDSYKYLRLALANCAVTFASNLKFGPEVGVGKIKKDEAVVMHWFNQTLKIVADLELTIGKNFPSSRVFLADSRSIASVLEPNSISAVITSPPYPNEKDYTRTTRLESVLLGFLKSKEDLRQQKKNLIRSNTRNVYKDDADHHFVKNFTEITRIAKAIEERRIAMNKNSGFERLYHKVAQLYFGGMAKHLIELSRVLRPGARLAYVVGDQASYLRVLIKTGSLIAEIAETLGYTVEGIDLFRTRFSTATKNDLNEEVVLLKWN